MQSYCISGGEGAGTVTFITEKLNHNQENEEGHPPPDFPRHLRISWLIISWLYLSKTHYDTFGELLSCTSNSSPKTYQRSQVW